jgi:hypothetical protein
MANEVERSARVERASRRTQCNEILALLKSRTEVGLPEILKIAAQYSARIHELRALGHRIVNRREGGKSFFRLVKAPPAPASVHAVAPPRAELAEDFLFPPVAYRDPEESGR